MDKNIVLGIDEKAIDHYHLMRKVKKLCTDHPRYPLIELIKCFRGATRFGLKEAKDVIAPGLESDKKLFHFRLDGDENAISVLGKLISANGGYFTIESVTSA